MPVLLGPVKLRLCLLLTRHVKWEWVRPSNSTSAMQQEICTDQAFARRLLLTMLVEICFGLHVQESPVALSSHFHHVHKNAVVASKRTVLERGNRSSRYWPLHLCIVFLPAACLSQVLQYLPEIPCATELTLPRTQACSPHGSKFQRREAPVSHWNCTRSVWSLLGAGLLDRCTREVPAYCPRP